MLRNVRRVAACRRSLGWYHYMQASHWPGGQPSLGTRASNGRRNPAIRALGLGAVLLLAVSAACSSEPDPTATQSPTATTPPTATSAPSATTPPAADPTDASTGQVSGSLSATEAPASGLDPDATVSGELAGSPTSQPSVTVEVPTDEPTAAATPEAPPVGVNVGDTLPHFEMTLADGSRVSTDVLAAQGKPVFLYFWATW